MVTWKLVEPLLTPHRRYPDKMTSPFVWKSIASTRPEEYPQVLPLGLLDWLRQQSQLARRKNNYLMACPTIPNFCFFVGVVVVVFFDSWTRERVDRFRFFSLKEPFFVRCLNYSTKVCWICLLGVKEHDIVLYKTDRRCKNKSFITLIGVILSFLVVDRHWYILCNMDVYWFSLVASFYGT